MEIKVAELDDRPTRVEFQLSSKEFNRLDERWEFEQIVCHAEVTKKGEALFIFGKYHLDAQTTCDLCLQPITVPIDNEFELSLMAAEDRLDPEGDTEISVFEPNIDYFEGEKINVSLFFEDQLLLDMPLTARCQEECQGICPTCGINKNTESCQCTVEPVSNPFAILKDLKPDKDK